MNQHAHNKLEDAARASPAVACVVTAYKPDAKVSNRLAVIASQVSHLYVVDNTPGGSTLAPEALPANSTLLSDGVNKGIARALNLGIERAIEGGATFVLLFDQDSTPPPNYVRQLLTDSALLANAHYRVAVVAPLLIDERTGAPAVPKLEPTKLSVDGMHDCSSLPTSGMLISTAAFRDIGEFDTKLFLDFVDFEWCWRARSKGYVTVRSTRATLTHNLGYATRRIGKLVYNVPAPYRHYFQFRDTLNLALYRHGPVLVRGSLLAKIVAKFFVYPFILDSGLTRFRWMCLGTLDFVRRKRGIGSARSVLDARR